MIKKLMSGIIALLMIGAVLAGCAQDSNEGIVEKETKENSSTTITLSMYLMSEKEVSAEQVEKIETAANKITRAKFKIQLELRYFTPDEYYTKLEDSMAAYRQEIEDRKKNTATTTTVSTSSGEVLTEATFINEDGIPELVYPTITGNQVDIFYFGGYDKFLQYKNGLDLAKLDNELTTTSKLLSAYIAPQFLSYAKAVAGGTYAIPNNRAVGEYTVLVLNKAVLKDYTYLNRDETTKLGQTFTSLTCSAVQSVLSQVAADPNHNDKLPLYMENDEIPTSGIRYFATDSNGRYSGAFSVLGGAYQQSWLYKTKNQYTPVGNLLENAQFLEQVRKYTEYKENGYLGTEADQDKEFAVGYVKGNADVLTRFSTEDYATVVLEYPTIETADVFEHMFGVFDKTASVSKSMEIITYLNTNEDFRNLIQYGIEGDNYELVDSDIKGSDDKPYKVVKTLNENYSLDPLKTGNNVILLPLHKTDLANVREYDKIQLRALKVSLMMGFDPSEYDAKAKEIVSVADFSMNELRALSEEIYAELKGFDTVAELNDYLVTATEQVNDNKYFVAMADVTFENEDPETFGAGIGFNARYLAWLTEMGVYEEPKDPEA